MWQWTPVATRLADPGSFACTTLRRAFGVLGVEFLFNHANHLFDGQIGVRVAGANAGDTHIADSAVEIRGEDLPPPGRIGARSPLVGHRLRAQFDEVVPG